MLPRLTHLRRSLVLSLAGVCANLALCGGADAAAGGTGQKHILVLHASRRDAQISILADRELPKLIEAGLSRPLDYYSEYIDLARFSEPGYEDVLRDFLHRKYEKQPMDVVVAMQENAIAFLNRYRRELFGEAPVVFLANEKAPLIPNATGVVAKRRFDGTILLARALQPDLREVVVVSGAERSDRSFAAEAREQFQRLGSGLSFTFLTGLVVDDLETRLRRLPPHSAVYYLLVSEDGAGENYHPLEYLDRVASIAAAPTYSWVESAIGHGIVGGSLLSQEVELQAMAGIVRRVLAGENPAAIPVASPDLNIPQVDARQLRRWRVSESLVPPEAVVKFAEPGVWDRNKGYIIGALMLLIAETLLIAGLLIQRRMRRRAEELVRDREGALRRSYERIHDLGGRLLQAQEAERARIARELHDDVNQQVALLAIDLELLKQGGERKQDAGKMVEEACDRAHAIAKSVHDMSHRLHPARLRMLGVVPALAGLQRELSRPDFAIAFSHENVPSSLSQEISLCLFRVVQEALHNAMKHSGASHVSVHLHGDIDALDLTIVDDGVGFDVQKEWGRGVGLVSMGERVETVDGTFDVQSRPGKGTRLAIRVPLHPASSVDVAVV
jgi:signal transduction histidine kinase